MDKYSGLLVDSIIILIAVIIIFYHRHKGFVGSIAGIVSIASAIYLAKVFSYLLVDTIDDKFKGFVLKTEQTSKILSFIIVFIIAYLAVKLLLKIISSAINHVPILGAINRFFGFIIGIAIALFWVQIIALFISAIGGDFIEKTYALKFIYDNNIIMPIIDAGVK